MPARLVQRVHFEDFGGHEFERLVFAYHVRAGWSDLAWYGQAGGDGGRDILGQMPRDDGSSQAAVIQCANRNTLTLAKAEGDMEAALAASSNTVAAFKFVARGTVSASRRDAVKDAATRLGIRSLTIWSGVEFEEHLRLIGEDLLRRFCEGEEFPDRPDELRTFALDFPGLSDADALTQMAAVFQRPAFETPFQQESSLPAFQSAIEDTLAALNSGIWRTREGDVIRRIPSLHHLRDPHSKAQVIKAAQLVDRLRRIFVAGLRDNSIRPCGCGDPNCPTFMLEDDVAELLDATRREALEAFRGAHAPFVVRLG